MITGQGKLGLSSSTRFLDFTLGVSGPSNSCTLGVTKHATDASSQVSRAHTLEGVSETWITSNGIKCPEQEAVPLFAPFRLRLLEMFSKQVIRHLY